MSAEKSLPVVYSEAVSALVACRKIEDAKYFADKADALAAWARIYHDGSAGREARLLKLHAYRRMGELAEELRPSNTLIGGGRKGLRGKAPGARSLLIESGLSKSDAECAARLGRASPARFSDLTSAKRPPSPIVAIRHLAQDGRSEGWRTLRLNPLSPLKFRSFCRANDAASLARSLVPDEARLVKEVVTEISEWLDEFEQHLP